MNKESELIFKRIVEEARADPNILSLFLSGSRGKGFETEHSDYDIVMVIENKRLKVYEKRFPFGLSIPPLLNFLFGLEGRHAPFLGYLERELERYPLEQLPFKVDDFLEFVDRASSGNVAAQGHLFEAIETISLEAGLRDVLTAWGDAYGWMKTYPDT